jgi:hypothetical protein
MNIATRRQFLLGSAAFSALGLAGCGSEVTPPAATLVAGKNAALAWNETTLKAVRSGALGPTAVARALAMVHTAMYDAWTVYNPLATPSLPLGKAALPSGADLARETAVSFAAYRVLLDLYPAQKALFDAQMSAMGLDASNTTTQTNTAEGVGNLAAANLLAFRHVDGSNQKGDLAPGAYADYTGYAPVNGVGSAQFKGSITDPNRWQPMQFSNGRTPGFLTPHWARVKGFSLKSNSELRPSITLPAFGSAAYKDQVDEVISLTANLTDEQKVIVEYWANGPGSETPPGTWNLFAQQISKRDQHGLEKDLKMFMLLGNAMLDASIVCWDCKRHFDSVRPITAVRLLYSGQTIKGFTGPLTGIGTMSGDLWLPYQPDTFISPPHPDFTSGHSTFSAAGAEILRMFTGSDSFNGNFTAPARSMLTEQGVPSTAIQLSWSTFTSAAEQAGMSRLYGGIHFMNANVYGKSSGRKVAASVWDRAQALFTGQG